MYDYVFDKPKLQWKQWMETVKVGERAVRGQGEQAVGRGGQWVNASSKGWWWLLIPCASLCACSDSAASPCRPLRSRRT